MAIASLHTSRVACMWLMFSLLAGCGGGGGGGSGGSDQFTIGGTITGLSGTVVLQNNGGNNLSRSANGKFTFSSKLPAVPATR